MAGTLSLSSTIEVFPCPNCREIVNTSLERCPFCSAPIDRATAEASAAETSKISQACSDASYLKIMVGMILTFILLIFVPFLSLAGIVGLWFLRFAIPVMAIRWWIKFGRIKTNDPDFVRARRAAIIVSIIAVLHHLHPHPRHRPDPLLSQLHPCGAERQHSVLYDPRPGHSLVHLRLG
jgi:hypothetical protein